MTFDNLRNNYFQAETGSVFLAQKTNNNISLRSGQFFAGAGETAMRFESPGVNMTLPKKALALITVRRNKQTSITLLDSGNSPNVFVNVAYQQRGIALKSGDVLEVTPAAFSSGAPKIATTRNVQNVRYTAHKSKANMVNLLERNMLLNCRHLRLAQAWPYEQLDHRYGRFGQRLAQPQPRITGSVTEVIRPIAYIQPSLPNAWMSARAVVKEIANGHYFLSSGTILAHATIPLIFDTPNGTVTVKQNSVALISSQETMTRVFDLHDERRNGVVAVSGQTSLNLNPGSEVALMARSQGDISRVVLGDNIGHKNIRVMKIGGGHGRGMVTGEFSMSDLLAYHPLLQKLRKSTDKNDQELVKSLMKTAAARASMDFGG